MVQCSSNLIMAPTNIKRKLRKTRRSLNEMRNRIYLAKSYNQNLSNMKKNAIIKPIISDNHLMFPNKMVRSETITRTALYESKQTCTNMSMVNNKYKHCNNKVIDIVECHSTETDSDASKSVGLSSCSQGYSVENKESGYNDKSQNDKTMSSSLHSEQELSENIYDILECSFSKQINDTASDLLLTEIIDKKKQSLKNIFSSIDMLSPPKLSIQVKTIVNNCKADDSTQMVKQSDYKGFACQHLQIAYSGNISSSADSIHSATIYTSPTSKCQNVYDSPEHSYYPHRLNYQD